MWDLEYRKQWCQLINSISIETRIKEWFEHRDSYNTNPDSYNYENSCDFLNQQIQKQPNIQQRVIDNDEIPF